ncbi:hypothetical protein ACKI1S_38395 [Streptomyces galilaeus]|uniref:Tip attachment protein J domain-containing protein n=1 Tax=Streptomyces galilaeus TaxID=33899 RepID=A0ABW9IU59_STRGJ
MVSWPLERIGELLVDGQWVSVPLRESTRVSITRGITAEGSQARPGGMTVRVNDPDALYSPRNAESGLYEKWGQGSQFRFRVGDVPATPAPVMTDAFDRTVANGWGSSTSGIAWSIWDPAGASPPASEFSVSGGAGKMTATTHDSDRFMATSGLAAGDYEITYTITTSTVPASRLTEAGTAFVCGLRLDTTNVRLYMLQIVLLPNTGLPGNGGLRVAIYASRYDSASSAVALSTVRQIPLLTYAAGSALRVRVRCEGPEIRARVWPADGVEPEHWHFQAYDATYTSGEVALGAVVRGNDTPLPTVNSFADLTIRPLAAAADTVRMVGEVAGILPYEDENGPASAYVDLDVAGVLRRYDGPQKSLLSALRRRLAVYGPVAYWAFEEGAQGDRYVAEVGDVSTAGPLAVTGLEFARDATLLGSGPLPTVQAAGTLKSQGIPGQSTNYWSVYFMGKIASKDFPASGAHQVLRFLTNTATYTVSVQTIGGSPSYVLSAVSSEGVSLGSVGITDDDMVAAGLPSFLDRWQQIKVYAEQSGATTLVGLTLQTGGTGLFILLPAAAITADQVRRIDTTFGSGAAGMGIGHLTVWGSTHTGAYTQLTPNGALLEYELGAPGLKARDWMTALSCDQATALDAYGPGETVLGPYAQDSFVALERAAAETDMGLLVEQRDTVGLRYISRQDLYNRPVDLVLDYRSGMVFAPFQPKDDDKDLHNRITAKRRGGSEATVELTTGRRSVQPPPDGIGVQDTSAETIVESDSQLPGQAGWRLHLATWDEMRVASLTLKMANARMRPLLDTVLKLREGSRVRVINTPKRYGPDGFDLLVRGTKEIHGEGVFDLTLTCVPYGPYIVGGLAVYEDFEDTTYTVPLTFGGTLPWTRSQLHFNTGTWSLRSGAITNNQTSDAIMQIPAGSTEMRFWYWTSSEASGPGFEGDRLVVLVDGVQVLRAQGITPWSQAVVDVTGKTQVIFRYVKDNSASSGEDAVHIDDVSFTGRAPARVDTDGSVLLAAATATATELLVATPGAQPWSTSPVYLPLDMTLGGEEVRTTAIASWALDAFPRTVSGGWGTADSGQVWGVIGGTLATDYAVGSGYGSHVLTTVNASRRSFIDFTWPDVDVVVNLTTSAAATGGSLYGGPVARYVDADNLYMARVEFTTGNAVLLDVRKRAAAVETSLRTYVSPITHVAGTFVRCRLQVAGSTIRAKVWPAAAPEPQSWHVAVTDTSVSASNFVGCRSISAAGNTNVNPGVMYDAFEVLSPQNHTVIRSRNGVARGWPAGTALSLAQPAASPL